MYYTDVEIYSSIKRGVEPSILAQLNGCKIAEIQEAYSRYCDKIKKRDESYRNQINRSKNPSNTAVKSDTKVMREKIIMNPNAKRKKFTYNSKIENEIMECLKQGMKSFEIYENLFESMNSKPSLKAFSVKCSKMRKTIEKEEYIKAYSEMSNVNDKNIEEMSEQELNLSKQFLKEELNKISKQYEQTIYKLAKVDLLLSYKHQQS